MLEYKKTAIEYLTWALWYGKLYLGQRAFSSVG